MKTLSERSAAHLRSEIGRLRLARYLVGAEARINPIKLGRLLNERDPLSPEMADRILVAIRKLETEVTDQ
jgi:hypothetical protein